MLMGYTFIEMVLRSNDSVYVGALCKRALTRLKTIPTKEARLQSAPTKIVVGKRANNGSLSGHGDPDLQSRVV